MKKLKGIVLMLIVLISAGSFRMVNAASGDIDTTFDSGGTGTDSWVDALAKQSDGKIIVAGEGFTEYDGVARNNIVRINIDGSIDSAFDPGSGADCAINSAAIQSDGKIVIGGCFSTYDGVARNHVARLNSNGSLDASFNPGVYFSNQGLNLQIYTISILSDGRIVVGGKFSVTDGSYSTAAVAIINPDGSLDETFDTGGGANDWVMAIKAQSDDKIILGGFFTTYGGVGVGGILRIDADGSIDPSFDSGTGVDSGVYAITIQSDNKIILGGEFTEYDGTPRSGIARVAADGSLDNSFDSGQGVGTGEYIEALAIQSDNKIIIGGYFSSYDGTSINNIARINADGSLDDSFVVGTGANDEILSLVIQADGKIVVAGGVTDYNGTSVGYIFRVLPGTPLIVAPTISVASPNASNISNTEATITANLSDTGGEDPIRGIEYGIETGVYTVGSCTAATGGTGDYSCVLTGLTPGTTYFARAEATNSAGTTYGTEVEFATIAVEEYISVEEDDADPMDSCRPTKLRAKGVSANQVKLMWKDNCHDEDGYQIERKKDKGKFKKIATIKKNHESYVDDKLQPDTKYTYRVRAHDDGSDSDYSNEDAARTFEVSNLSVAKTAISTDNFLAIGTAPIASDTIDTTTNVGTPSVPSGSSEAVAGKIDKNPKKKDSAVAQKTKIMSDFIGSPVGQKVSVAVEALGLLMGTIAVAATSAIPLLALSSSAPFTSGLTRGFSFFGILTSKGKKKKWGVVFDSDTHQPLAGVMISIISAEGKVLDSMSTNASGNFGFLATQGEYSFKVSAKDYVMVTDKDADEFYGKIYSGKTFIITEADVAEMNIALKSTKINWQELSKRKIAAYKTALSIAEKHIFMLVFFICFAISIGILYLVTSVINAIIVALYLAMAVYKLFFRFKKYGLITSMTGEPLPFSMVSLYAKDQPERRVAYSVSDILGRYFVLAEDRGYSMKLQGRKLGGQSFKRLFDIKVKDGVFKKDIRIDEGDFINT